MSDGDKNPGLPADPASRAEGRWRAIEGILQELKGLGRSQAGEKALAQLRAEAAHETPSDGQASHPYVQELMQRYVAGELDPLEADALQILLRCDNPSAAEFQRIREGQGQPHLAGAEDPSQTDDVVPTQDRPLRKSSSRVLMEQRLVDPKSLERSWSLRRYVWGLAAACALALSTGLIWTAVSSRPPAPGVAGAAPEESRHRKEVLQRIAELDREAKALAAAQRAAAEEGRPVPAPPEAPQPNEDAFTQTVLPPTEDELAQRKKDAEECARILDQQRLLLLSELDSTRKVKRPAESDEDPEGTAVSAKTAIATPTPVAVEAGCVVYVEGETAQAVLIRALEGSAHRTNLTAGTKIMRGDRIEVERGGQAAAARLELQGGTTIDLAAKTTLQVVDRNAVRLETGQIYACINRDVTSDKDVKYTTSFSLQTPAARYLVEEARVEIFASPAVAAQARTTARVDSGQVHVVNSKGHVMGRKGQEVSASANAAPNRNDGFRAPIWRGRNLTHPGLPFGKGSPVLLSNENPFQAFSTEYSLALAHTGEIDLKGIQIVHDLLDVQGAQKPDLQMLWRDTVQELGRLRTAGLRFTSEPVMGSARCLQRPPSGRCEDTTPERSPAVDQLLIEARKTTSGRPLVVVASGSLTDLASAWLLDHTIVERTVVVTAKLLSAWNEDVWASTIVLEKYPCVLCSVLFQVDTLPRSRLRGTRWDFLIPRLSNKDNTDFSQFVCVTVPGFVQSVERARFVRGASGNPSDFRFEADPNGLTWLVKRTDDQLMAREFEATFITGSGAP